MGTLVKSVDSPKTYLIKHFSKLDLVVLSELHHIKCFHEFEWSFFRW
jgi:hypothetical protein